MRILVLGGTGMAGHTISIYFKEKEHDVTVFSRSSFSKCKNIIGDATNFEFLKGVIKQGNFDAIINAIGILNENASDDKERAVLLNAYLPHFLSRETENMRTKIIHMSTDCVFSGEKGRYKEDSLRDGRSFYDRSKALGEIDNKKDLTFRNSIIGPDMNKNGIGLFNWFMQQEDEIKGFTKAIWTGVTTLTLAKAMEKALKEDISGVYNLVNNKIINKYELLELFNKCFKNKSLKIIPYEKVNINKSLVNTRKDFSFEVPNYEKMVGEMREWIINHKDLYPHYLIEEGKYDE